MLAIRNCLIAREPIALDAIEAVISHPQPLAQCARFLRTELRGAAVRAAASTADAVRTVAGAASRGPRSARTAPPSATAAACCARRSTTSRATRRASSGSGTRAARRSSPTARARGRRRSSSPAPATRSPGWLVRCLSEFAFRGVNLTKIESRPLRGRLGHYLFHVDMEGRVDEPSVADAVSALDAHCEEVRLLGTYPAA